MSDKCGNCDCQEPVKKGYIADIFEIEKSNIITVVMEDSFGENDGKCKCGSSCSCPNCTCGAH